MSKLTFITIFAFASFLKRTTEFRFVAVSNIKNVIVNICVLSHHHICEKKSFDWERGKIKEREKKITVMYWFAAKAQTVCVPIYDVRLWHRLRLKCHLEMWKKCLRSLDLHLLLSVKKLFLPKQYVAAVVRLHHFHWYPATLSFAAAADLQTNLSYKRHCVALENAYY